MARKRDIKQFRQACKEVGLTPRERYEASEALHAEKGEAGVQGHMSYGELLALAATMEAALMATVVALDASPANVLRSMRGSIVGAVALGLDREDAAGADEDVVDVAVAERDVVDRVPAIGLELGADRADRFLSAAPRSQRSDSSE